MGFAIWWRYRAQWGALKQFKGTVHGAHGKPLQIAGRTEHLNIQGEEARGRASFIVIVGLESPPCLIGMDIMRPLRVHIDVTNGTATPAQPDPQTVHLNAVQSQQPQIRLPSQTTGLPLASQPLEETPSPRASLSPEGTADPSSTQPQQREIPLSGDRSSALPSPESLTNNDDNNNNNNNNLGFILITKECPFFQKRNSQALLLTLKAFQPTEFSGAVRVLTLRENSGFCGDSLSPLSL